MIIAIRCALPCAFLDYFSVWAIAVEVFEQKLFEKVMILKTKKEDNARKSELIAAF